MAAPFILCTLAMANVAHAHIAAFAKGMFCENGTDPKTPNYNSNAPVAPLFNLTLEELWFQRDRGCDRVPPPEGVFLDLPAGGSFTVDLVNNQAFSRLSYDGRLTTIWPDGGDHPADWNGGGVGEGCLEDGGYMHVQDQQRAQGTAFAISYQSDLNEVTLENLVVFSVLEHTPWHREATYQVPSALPACPPGGCTCAWLWVPRGCGQPNIYMQGFRCQVSGATATAPLAKAQPPAHCEDDPSTCVQGAKQMIVWNQRTGNNVFPKNGQTPAYNSRNGFKAGAQDDIFAAGLGLPSSSLVLATSISSTASVSGTVAILGSGTTQAVAISRATATLGDGSFPILPSSLSTSTTAALAPRQTTFSTIGRSYLPSDGLTNTAIVTVAITAPAEPAHSGVHTKHYRECLVEYLDEE